jgi:hypothetical protein
MKRKNLALVAMGVSWVAAAACVGDSTVEDSGAPDSSTKDQTVVDVVTNDTGTSDASDGGCPAGFEDLDKNTSNGCETKTPAGIQPSSLKLWLRADRGLGCTSGHVTGWADQSGSNDNATPAGSPGPRCGGVKTLNGFDVPVFQRSVVPDSGLDAALGVLDDNTLAVDLSFMVGTAYTVFVVEQRSDFTVLHNYPMGAGSLPNYACGPDAGTDRAFHFGYRNGTDFTAAQFCDDYDYAIDAGKSPIEAVVNVGGDGGRAVFFDNAAASPLNTQSNAFLAGNAAGRIGRGYETTTFFDDTRYIGYIAEVIVYTAPLSDNDRAAVTTYLHTHWALP